MASLIRWSPMRATPTERDVFDMMDRMLSDFYGSESQGSWGRQWNLPLDVSEREDEYVIKASMPGINPDNIDLSIDENVLTIRGESQEEQEEESEQFMMRERRFGSFQRSIALPTSIDRENIDASCSNGVLTIRVPKAETARPRRIEVKATGGENGEAGGQKVIEGRSTSTTRSKKSEGTSEKQGSQKQQKQSKS